VALLDDSIERAGLLGRRMAEALNHQDEPYYRGGEDNPEFCPVCHGDVLQLNGNRVRCPVCNIQGDVRFSEEGKMYVAWDGGAELCRLNDNPNEEEVHVKQRAPFKAVKEHKDRIRQVKAEISEGIEPLLAPPLQ
jgi:hypothetical protein